MALISINKNPGDRELRQFACIFLPLFCVVLGCLLYFKWNHPNEAWIPGAVAVVSALVGFIVPRAIKPIFVGSMYVTFPIGWVMSHILLMGMFYLVLTPIGLLMRLFGYDPMQRKLDRAANTYWIPHKPNVNLKRYFKQY